MEVRHLAALVAVDRQRSFRGAAASLSYAQSAVSQRVAQIERQFGTRLVVRSRGRSEVALTEAGSRLVEHAGSILTELDAALADLRALTDGREGTLDLGAYEGISTRLLPWALRRLSARAQGLRVAVHEDSDWERFAPLVADGRLDAAFGELPLPDGPFAFRELIRDPYVLLVPADSPLADRPGTPTVQELGSLELIAPRTPLLRRIRAHLRAAGIEARPVSAPHSDGGIPGLVAEGAGVALTARMATDPCNPRVVAIPLEGTLPARRVCLYWHRQRRNDENIKRLLSALAGAADGLERNAEAGEASRA